MTPLGEISALLLYDVEGWAWWHRAHNVRRHVSAGIRLDVAKLGDDFDYLDYDFVVIFEAMCFEAVMHIPRQKLIVGCSCPKLLHELVALMRQERPAAALVNNAAMAAAMPREYRCYCCPNGVDVELFTPALVRPACPQGAWVGSTRSFVDKGLQLVKDACDRVGLPLMAVDQGSVIGEGRLFTQPELRDNVYQRATLYLCGSEAEGTPNPALEALACGVPVISTRVGNMPEVIRDGENGFLVDRSVDAFQQAIDEVGGLDDAKVSGAARKSILSGWTWRQQARRYAAMFQDLARCR